MQLDHFTTVITAPDNDIPFVKHLTISKFPMLAQLNGHVRVAGVLILVLNAFDQIKELTDRFDKLTPGMMIAVYGHDEFMEHAISGENKEGPDPYLMYRIKE